MPSTSVHLPESVLKDLDHLASETGVSRNRLIVEACRERLRKRREWPQGFFDDGRCSAADLEEFRASTESFEQALATRRNRNAPPF